MDNEVYKSENSTSGSASMFWVLLLIIFFIWLLPRIFKKGTWRGFYYPNSDDLLSYEQSPVYSTLEECRGWAKTQISIYNPNGEGFDYECGKNCQSKEGLTSLVCDETVR